MKNQLQGIALILFGMLLALTSDWLCYSIDRYIYLGGFTLIPIGVILGFVGVCLVFVDPNAITK